MKKLIAATLVALALSTPAFAFDISTIDGIPSDMKDTIAKQSGGRITNKQAGQQGQQGQAGQDGQQQGGQKSRKKLSAQDKAMQQADQYMKGGDAGSMGQGLGSFR